MEYTISKVAEKVGLTAYTLRYYEKEGLIPDVKKNDNGIRIYREEDVFWIELIKCLKDTGMPISEIHRIVELSLEGEDTIPQRKEILQQHKNKLENQMEHLKMSMKKIDKKLDWYDGKEKGC
ncbi:MAG: MerR family transcriptional regulator [Cellulosilyticaceae bacterium]